MTKDISDVDSEMKAPENNNEVTPDVEIESDVKHEEQKEEQNEDEGVVVPLSVSQSQETRFYKYKPLQPLVGSWVMCSFITKQSNQRC